MDSVPAPDARPPMSTTSLPESPESPSDAPPAAIKPPVLASDILLEDVAPKQPAESLLRLTLGIVAAVFGGLAGLELGGVFVGAGAWGELAIASVAIALLVLPVPYVPRAALAALTGLVPLAIGTLALAEAPARKVAALASLAILPGVFFFRARYRALAMARVVLAVAFVLGAPGLALLGLGVLDEAAPLALRVTDAAFVGGALAGAFGFMGAETTGMCGVWAATTLALGSAHVGLIVSATGWRAGAAAAVLCASCATLLALAVFQGLAAAFAASARKVDVHRPVMRSESSEVD